jgi:hypothetical protein
MWGDSFKRSPTLDNQFTNPSTNTNQVPRVTEWESDSEDDQKPEPVHPSRDRSPDQSPGSDTSDEESPPPSPGGSVRSRFVASQRPFQHTQPARSANAQKPTRVQNSISDDSSDSSDMELDKESPHDEKEKPKDSKTTETKKVLRPSATQKKQEQAPQKQTSPTFTAPSTGSRVPLPSTAHLSPNIKLLQRELAKLQDEKHSEKHSEVEKVQNPRHHNSNTTISQPNSNFVAPASGVTTMLCPECSETRYILRTCTDNGRKWGEETKLTNPNQSRLYYTLGALDPDGPVPESHFPIVVSGDCCTTIRLDLSYFPIRNHGKGGTIPPNAVRGATHFTILCFPNVLQEKKATFTCEIVPDAQQITVKSLHCKTSVALRDDVLLQVQMFRNSNDVLEPWPAIADHKPNLDKRDKTDPLLKSYLSRLWYLDMHVAHRKHDMLRHRLYWIATAAVTMNVIPLKED